MALPISVVFVCTGNICRSPIGEVVLRDLVAAEGLTGKVEVTSAGTGNWHVGEPADERAQATLRRHGHDATGHRAKQFQASDFASTDVVVALDRTHLRALRSLARSEEDRAKIRLLRSFDPDATAAGTHDVADPYFGVEQDFEQTYTAVAAANRGLLEHVRELLAERA